ncbi:hypothetical protein K492DRAFT_228836 [Lichtheimia hyalospora FSU 10163]|nr:hypothetical protein K492DRAFT_228836 [Lichtheimia hyalospora FSU 10163]
MTSNDDEVDLRALNYTETINANLICCICQAPFIDPVVLVCGHTFCSTCIYQACDASPVCPIDRSPVSTDDIQPAVKIISNMVNELLVECPRSEEGCTHVGQRQYVENHVKSDCQYTFTSCDLEECKALVLKKDLTTHVSTCKYRPAECKMCKRKMRAIELEDHHRLCPAEIIQCPHCDTSRPRSEHPSHLLTCPRHPVTCTHADFGCPWQGDREALETKHTNECAYEGIKDYLHQQQQRDQMLRDQIKAVSKENEMLKRQHDELSQQFHTLSDKLALMFPSHFIPDGPTGGESPPPMTETQRLKNEIDTISTNLQNLELKQNMTLMTETFRLQEEMQSLRTICHGMRMQMHYLMMDRRGAATAASAGAHHHEPRASSSNAAAVAAAASDNNATAGSVPVLNKMRSWLDAPNMRQDTKL